MLWMSGITIPIMAISAYYFSDVDTIISYACIFIIFILVIVICGVFIYFAIRHPEKLQSEDYQLRHQSLQWMQQKSGNVEISPVSLDQIVNPLQKTLEVKGEE